MSRGRSAWATGSRCPSARATASARTPTAGNCGERMRNDPWLQQWLQEGPHVRAENQHPGPDLRLCGALGGTRTPNLLIRRSIHGHRCHPHLSAIRPLTCSTARTQSRVSWARSRPCARLAASWQHRVLAGWPGSAREASGSRRRELSRRRSGNGGQTAARRRSCTSSDCFALVSPATTPSSTSACLTQRGTDSWNTSKSTTTSATVGSPRRATATTSRLNSAGTPSV